MYIYIYIYIRNNKGIFYYCLKNLINFLKRLPAKLSVVYKEDPDTTTPCRRLWTYQEIPRLLHSHHQVVCRFHVLKR